ncbi:MAG: FAD-binding oxidoreductase [Alphaproteobacteria bacterium]
MSDIVLNTQDGGTTTVATDDLDGLRTSLRGSLCLPGDDGYNEGRTLWNAMIDRKPGAIVRCAGAADVVRAVNFARENSLQLAVRSAGHNIAGNAVCDGGLVIDLSPMKSVRVDPINRTARVEPGVTLGDLDNEAQGFGLATPLGINSTTGVAGLTLGGGFGWLSRKYGMTVDNLLAADVVTAAGELVRVSESEEPDLFWAIRGGGGNFGVATSFEFRLHQVGPEVMSGLIVHPYAHAAELFEKYKQFVSDVPDELTVWVVLRKAPPLPFLPEEWHGKEVFIFAACHAGDLEEGRRALAPLQAIGEPIADVISPHPFLGWQTAFDPLLTPGARNYWKSHDFAELGDAAIGAIIEYAGNLPTPECEILVVHLGGAMSRVAKDAMAYPHRDTQFILNVHTRWREPEQDAECIGWARKFFNATAPHATGGVYVNFMPEDEVDRVQGAYGPNFDRLGALKAKYDPANLFRLNQNIQPAKAAA